jgi:hypothetical protein
LDTTIDERPGAVIVPAREGEFEFRHRWLSPERTCKSRIVIFECE